MLFLRGKGIPKIIFFIGILKYLLHRNLCRTLAAFILVDKCGLLKERKKKKKKMPRIGAGEDI